MRLYAQVTSDRASKGQGGNKEISIELTADSAERIQCGIVSMDYEDEGDVNAYAVWFTHPVTKTKKLLYLATTNKAAPGPLDWIKTETTAKLKGELEDVQTFLSEPTSSIGRYELSLEQALIRELAERDKNKGKKKKGDY